MSTRDVTVLDDGGSPKKRTRLVRQYPIHALENATAIAQAIQELNGGLPFDRVLLAKALGTTPASSGFTMRLNSSGKYGLTQGGYSDERITLTTRGEAVAAPKQSGERQRALLEAALQPELFREFYRALDGKRMPEDEYARNMLHRDYGVQPELADECLNIIKRNGLFVGILGEVGGSLYVSQSGVHAPEGELEDASGIAAGLSPSGSHAAGRDLGDERGRILLASANGDDVPAFIQQTLDSFGIEYRVILAGDGDDHPPGQEATQAMRACVAAVLVLARPAIETQDGRIEARRKERMIFLLGAASALYGERVVLLRERGVERLPQETTFATIQFRQEDLAELALRLLQELHRMGVVRVHV